jgi:hypothetical protein
VIARSAVTTTVAQASPARAMIPDRLAEFMVYLTHLIMNAPAADSSPGKYLSLASRWLRTRPRSGRLTLDAPLGPQDRVVDGDGAALRVSDVMRAGLIHDDLPFTRGQQGRDVVSGEEQLGRRRAHHGGLQV